MPDPVNIDWNRYDQPLPAMLRSLRTHSGLGIQALGDKLGLSFARLRAFELGVATPNAQELDAIGSYYGLTNDELLGK